MTKSGPHKRRSKGGRSRFSSALNQIAALSPTFSLRRAMRLAERGETAEAFSLFALAARAGSPEAEFRVGRCYLRGFGVPINSREGMHWLGRAACKGHVDAQWMLAALYVDDLSSADIHR